MSITAMSWALDARKSGAMSPDVRLVLVALADYAQDDGTHAFPTVHRLAERLGVSERSVQRSIRRLQELGHVELGDQELVRHIPANRRPTVYTLALSRRGDDTVTPARGDDTVTPGVLRGDTRDRSGVTLSSPEPRTRPNNLTPPPIVPPPSHLDEAHELVELAASARSCSCCGALLLRPSELRVGACRSCLAATITVAPSRVVFG